MRMGSLVVLVTGATDGIGRHTAKRLVESSGARVLVHGRSEEKARAAIDYINPPSSAEEDSCLPIWGDLASVDGTLEVASQVEAAGGVDVLINNAGVFSKGPRKEGGDGLELTWAVNVLAPYVLTRRLLESGAVRKHIVNVASISATGEFVWDDLQLVKRYSDHAAYSMSKLASIAYTLGLSRRLREEGNQITANCLDPGTVDTKMLAAGWACGGIPVDAADDEYWLATDAEAGQNTGRYYVGKRETSVPRAALNRDAQDRLWDILEEQADKFASSGMRSSSAMP